jgi:hypothetical protein
VLRVVAVDFIFFFISYFASDVCCLGSVVSGGYFLDRANRGWGWVADEECRRRVPAARGWGACVPSAGDQSTRGCLGLFRQQNLIWI